MKIFEKAGCMLLPATLMWSGVNAAVPQVPEEEGVRGYVAFGVGFTDLESNTLSGNSVIDLDNDRLTDINGSASGRDTAHPVVVGEVTWTLGNRNQLFLGTSVEDAVTMDGGARAGWRKGTDNIGTFEVGAVFNKLIPLEVWEDPFNTGDPAGSGSPKRKKTDQTATGIRFDWDRIVGGLGWQVQARDIDIDKERSCERSLEPQCQGIDISLLERDADELSTKIYYTFDLGGGHSFRPNVGYKDHDADGDAEDFDALSLKLTYAYLGDKSNLVVNVGWAAADYDTNNPIYNDERDADLVGVDATYFYKLDIWDGNWSAFANALYGEVDSDINFYDSEIFRVAAGMAYRWK